MTRAEIRLANGDALTVDATVKEAEKVLSDAARSGQSRLAWFVESGTEARIAINPAQVVSLRIAGGRRGED